jgi:hypothetical protein
MAGPSFREKTKSYVDECWLVPCKDNMVWVYYAGINTQVEIQKRRLNAAEWKAAFLQYNDPHYGTLEGLYLIKTASLGRVKSGIFDADKYPERIMLSSWFDKKDKENANPEVLAQNPPYNGLNDCAHFVTESLAAGGINVRTRGVPQLLSLLRGLADTKTLALTVPVNLADNIVKAGIMDVGDVIIYSLTPTDHHHSTVYMGNEKIAMHTWANHPDHPTLKGDWKASATKDHPLVTLIHFGRDDSPAVLRLSLIGWWEVLVPATGQKYYYFFKQNGWAGWTGRPPRSINHPIAGAEGTGYWFEQGMSIKICWTKTGSFEKYDSVSPVNVSSFTGKWFGSRGVTDIKMSKLS